MKKFNIRKVLDGLKEVSSSTPSVQVGPQENHLIQETIQSEHFQLCKVGDSDALFLHLFIKSTPDFILLYLFIIYFFNLSRSVTVCTALIPSQDTAGACQLHTTNESMCSAFFLLL